MMQAPILYSVSAQHDNLGDIEIRRAMLAWLREAGRPLVVYGGSMSAEYCVALGLDPAQVETRPLAFERRLLGAALRGGAAFILAPGPQVFGSRKLALRSAINLCNAALVRFRHGTCIAVGRSLRGSPSIGRAIDKALIRRFNIFSVRDDVSSAQVGAHLVRYPDMAFLHLDRTTAVGERQSLTISLRFDRISQAEDFRPLVAACAEQGLDVVFASQVRRDDEQHARLAQELQVGAELWAGRSHEQQEAALRSLYRQSVGIVSNRLHGLIMAAQCGALPVALSWDPSDKIASTLNGVVSYALLEPAKSGRTISWLDRPQDLRNVQQRLDQELSAARAELASLKASVLATLRRSHSDTKEP